MVQENNELVAEIQKDKPRDFTTQFNRVMYGLFIALSIYYVFKNEWMTAASNLGIALLFDPFNQKIKWQQRPLYQRVWLLVHVSIVFMLFGIFIALKYWPSLFSIR